VHLLDSIGFPVYIGCAVNKLSITDIHRPDQACLPFTIRNAGKFHAPDSFSCLIYPGI